MRDIKYNGKLLNQITNEAVPCQIKARLRFRNAKAVYININRIPKSSWLGKAVGRPEPVPRYLQTVSQVSAFIKNFPLLLIDDENNTKIPVYVTSCLYRGKDFCHIRVRIAADGLKFIEEVEQRRSTILQEVPSV